MLPYQHIAVRYSVCALACEACTLNTIPCCLRAAPEEDGLLAADRPVHGGGCPVAKGVPRVGPGVGRAAQRRQVAPRVRRAVRRHVAGQLRAVRYGTVRQGAARLAA